MRENRNENESKENNQEVSEAPAGKAFDALPDAVPDAFSKSHEQMLLYGHSLSSA